MEVKVDLSKVVKADHIKGEDEEETIKLKEMLSEATNYLCSFSWCTGIEESYLGIGIGSVIGVFLFKISSSERDVDEWIWVIVGDLPSAYITTENSPNPACALDAYIGAMNEWVDAAKSGKSVEKLIPVNVPPTSHYAEMLGSRLQFLDKEILTLYVDDLKESK